MTEQIKLITAILPIIGTVIGIILTIKNGFSVKKTIERWQDKKIFLFEKYYYIQYKKGVREEIPYCPKCYDDNGKKVHLLSMSKAGKWKCGVCNINISDDNFHDNSSYPKSWTRNAELANRGIKL